MADNAQKTPLGQSINIRAVTKVLDHIQNLAGRAPVEVASMDKTNTIATLKFLTDGTYTLPNVTVPVHGPEYTRHPLKKGDKGVVGAFDIDLGNVTGLGASTPASFTRPGNLASLCFHPLGNKNFTPTDDAKKVVQYGATGTIHRDEKKKSQVSTDSTAGAQIAGGGDGNGNFDHTSTAASDRVHHKSKSKVTTEAPTHEVTQDQTVAGNHAVGGSSSVGGALSAASGLIGGIMMGGGSIGPSSAIAAAAGPLAGDATGPLGATIVTGATGLQTFMTQGAARSALGAWQFYIDSSVTVGNPGTLVVCTTGP